MITIGEMAMRAMINSYREMRANGLMNNQHYGTFGSLADYAEFWRVIQAETLSLISAFNARRDIAPHVADLAYAIAMTEQFPLGSVEYLAWREYESVLHARAESFNRKPVTTVCPLGGTHNYRNGYCRCGRASN